VTPAAPVLSGIGMLPSVFSVEGPVVSDQGVAYAAYSLPDSSGGSTGGIVRIAADGTVDPTFATFRAGTSDGTPGSQLVGNANTSSFALFGTTGIGGGNKQWGTVYSVGVTGGFTTIGSFDDFYNTGAGPGDIILDDGVLYGTCYEGGANNDGTVFSMPEGGGTPSLVGTFAGTNGVYPADGLDLFDGVLYGVTISGGANDYGVVFSVPAGGGPITPLASFPAGTTPNGHVVVVDGFVYGTIAQSGFSGAGSVFRVPLTPGGQLETAPFGTISATGQTPVGGLIDDAGTLVGVTTGGGTEDVGTVFKVNLNSFTVTTLADFPHHGTAGTLPYGALTSDSQGNVYGVAHGSAGEGNDQAYFWKLTGVNDNSGSPPGNGGSPPEHLKAPKLSPPAGSTIVKATTPKFKWTRVSGATSYELLITDVTPGIQDALSHPVDETGITGTSFILPDGETLNPGHYYSVQVRAIGSDPSQPGPWSNARKFKVAEQKTDLYRIRLDFSGGVSLAASGGVYTFTIQALDDSRGRPALGPPRVMIFGGAGAGFPGSPASFSLSSEWVEFTTPKKILVDDLAGVGGITSYPSVTTPLSFDGGILGELTTTRLTLGFKIKGRGFQEYLSFSNTHGIGLDTGTTLAGGWKLLKPPNYDPTLWPNKLVPN
jgi:uncharacterized repeat protein (TIGR03803 family)